MGAATDIESLKSIYAREMYLRGLLPPDEYKSANTASFHQWLCEVTPYFNWSWPYQRYIQQHLEDVALGKINKLMIFCPPRHGKSQLATVRYPVWRIHRNPQLRVIIGAYNQTLASTFCRNARRIARMLFPLSTHLQRADAWETPAGGGIRAVGVGTGVTGHGCHLLIIDDPVKSRVEAESETYRERVWEWYCEDLYTRLEPGGAIVLIMTRWHEDDLAGRILQSNDGPNWTVVRLPAEAEENDPLGRQPGEPLCPDRYDSVALNDRKLVLGSYGYNALYQGRPAPPEGSIIKREWLQFYDMPPLQFDEMIQSWDMSFKANDDNSYVVGQVWGRRGSSYYLIDQVRNHIDFPSTLRAVKSLSQRYPGALTKLVEDKANGPAVIQMLEREINGLIAVQADSSKEARLSAVAPLFEAGNVYLPAKKRFIDEYIHELCTFPSSVNDDQVDATSQALLHFVGNELVLRPRIIDIEDYASAETSMLDEDIWTEL